MFETYTVEELAVAAAGLLIMAIFVVRTMTWAPGVSLSEDERDGEGMISDRSGLWLKTMKWVPKDFDETDAELRGVVFVLHGFGGYFSPIRGLTKTMDKLSDEGFACFGVEMQGHGRSEGIRCHVTDFNHYVDDFLQFVQEVMSSAPFAGQPCFLMGQSMGGALAIKSNLRWEGAFSGVVLLAPMCAIDPAMIPAWPILQLLKVLALLFPTWAVIGGGGDITHKSTKCTSTKKKAMADLLEDNNPTRLAHGLVLLNTSQEVQASAIDFTAPLLICHGGDDIVCSPDHSADFLQNVGSDDKTFKLYDGLWHSLLDEPDGRDEVINDITMWLVKRAERESTH
jgi:acylglycerol lipase